MTRSQCVSFVWFPTARASNFSPRPCSDADIFGALLCSTHADAQLDYTQARLTEMPTTPDLIIAPSDLRYFARNAKGVLALNPGRLTIGRSGGTFAKVFVMPVPRPAIGQANGGDMYANLPERTRVEIVRI